MKLAGSYGKASAEVIMALQAELNQHQQAVDQGYNELEGLITELDGLPSTFVL